MIDQGPVCHCGRDCLNRGEKKMKPFDLKQALEGKRVVTREGLEVTQVHQFQVQDEMDLRAVLMGKVLSWTSSGRSYRGLNPMDWKNDLFLASEKKSGWVNILKHGLTLTVAYVVHKTEEDAKKYAKDNFLSINCITAKVEWEE